MDEETISSLEQSLMGAIDIITPQIEEVKNKYSESDTERMPERAMQLDILTAIKKDLEHAMMRVDYLGEEGGDIYESAADSADYICDEADVAFSIIKKQFRHMQYGIRKGKVSENKDKTVLTDLTKIMDTLIGIGQQARELRTTCLWKVKR